MLHTKGILQVSSRLGEGLSAISNILVPPTCLTCDRFVDRQGGCCSKCWSQLRFIAQPFCPVLGTPFSVDMGPDMLCAEAIANPPPFDRLRAVLLYDDLPRRMVSLMKYSDRTDLVPWMANWMKVAGRELIAEADAIVPIPLHVQRLRQRRFNQAAELARHAANAQSIEYAPHVLKRRKKTQQQVGLSQSQRERNLAGAFAVPEEQAINVRGRRMLLVDDVYTTGATTRAATRALKRAGADHVDVLVFAKVETHLI